MSASEGLLKRERRNCRSKFKSVPGRGRFHVRARGNESRPAVGTTALTDQTQATLYIPWAREMMEDMVEAGMVVLTEETFSEGVSQEEASVLIG